MEHREDLTMKSRPSEKELPWPACSEESQSREEKPKAQKEAYFQAPLGPSPHGSGEPQGLSPAPVG